MSELAPLTRVSLTLRHTLDDYAAVPQLAPVVAELRAEAAPLRHDLP